ncbi:MAG: Uma2 family endonuclease [Anaerolineae bacterium]|nr:Uma2 family endonuclease [Anaerolineae bacterium]
MTDKPMLASDVVPPLTDRVFRRISVSEYESMIQTDVLREDDNVELLEGWIVEKMMKNPEHSDTTQFLRDWLPSIIPSGYIVRDQEPIVTSDSQPEPDSVVLRGTRRDFSRRKPTPSEVVLVIEVADSSPRDDRNWKARIYARAGIPEYWIINLPERRVEVFQTPHTEGFSPGYQVSVVYGIEDAVPVVLEGREVGRLPVRELLP